MNGCAMWTEEPGEAGGVFVVVGAGFLLFDWANVLQRTVIVLETRRAAAAIRRISK